MNDRTRLANLALTAALVLGASYLLADHLPLAPAARLAWKASGVGFLAVYAALSARDLDGWLITAVMALGALGDLLLGAAGLAPGGAAFLAGNLIATALYLRHYKPSAGGLDVVSAAIMVPLVVFAAWRLSGHDAGVAVYAVTLAGMVATAQLSRFPRDWVGLGAVMVLASDLLLFARAGPLAGLAWVGTPIWSLYFAGQALVCVGVVRSKK